MLEGEGVTKYFGGLGAVRNVGFHVDQGEIVGLIGPNGAGKTTLFNLISGALVPKSGAIRFKGQNITGLKPHHICRMGVARTFQSVNLAFALNRQGPRLIGLRAGFAPRKPRPQIKGRPN
jgi:ABC-type branched-subunit amino acid transport system ATPase component